MADIKQQLEWVRDVRKKRLAVISCPLHSPERVLKTFHLTERQAAEKYAASVAPSRITDTKEMEVVSWYASGKE